MYPYPSYEYDGEVDEVDAEVLAARVAERDRVHGIRERYVQSVIARAFEVRGLVFERRLVIWLETVHHSFDYREVSDHEVAVVAPVGIFRLQARRSRRGEVKPIFLGTDIKGIGDVFQDQANPLVRIRGRLNPSNWPGQRWALHPYEFQYEDGTWSGDPGRNPHGVVRAPRQAPDRAAGWRASFPPPSSMASGSHGGRNE